MELCKDVDCDVTHTRTILYAIEENLPLVTKTWQPWKLTRKIVVVILLILKENGIIFRDPLANKRLFNEKKKTPKNKKPPKRFFCRYLHSVYILKKLFLQTVCLLKTVY